MTDSARDSFLCPKCGRQFSAQSGISDKKIRCPDCNQLVRMMPLEEFAVAPVDTSQNIVPAPPPLSDHSVPPPLSPPNDTPKALTGWTLLLTGGIASFLTCLILVGAWWIIGQDNDPLSATDPATQQNKPEGNVDNKEPRQQGDPSRLQDSFTVRASGKLDQRAREFISCKLAVLAAPHGKIVGSRASMTAARTDMDLHLSGVSDPVQFVKSIDFATVTEITPGGFRLTGFRLPDPIPDLNALHASMEVSVPDESSSVGTPLIRTPSADRHIRFPRQWSRYVVVGTNSRKYGFSEVWDATTKSRTGYVSGEFRLSDPIVPSADGKFMAAWSKQEKSLNVYGFESHKLVRRFQLGAEPYYFEFVLPGRLMITLQDESTRVFDLDSGSEVSQIDLPLFNTRGRFIRPVTAVSPDGRLFAIARPDDIAVFAIPAGTKRFSEEVRGTVGLAFSPDSKAIAAIRKVERSHQIDTWDVTTGSRGNGMRVPGMGSRDRYSGQAIEWLQDQSGWFIFGHAILDRRTLKISLLDLGSGHEPRRLIDNETALVPAGTYLNVVKTQTVQSTELAAGAAPKPPPSTRVFPEERTVLPNVTQAQKSTAATIRLAENPRLNVSLEPPPPGRQLIQGSLSMAREESRLVGIRMTDGSVVLAMFERNVSRSLRSRSRDRNARTAGPPRWVERIDLADGSTADSWTSPPSCNLVAISPDGSRYMTMSAGAGNRSWPLSKTRRPSGIGGSKQASRLDVWSATDGSHVSSLGFDSDPKESAKVPIWFDFASNDRVLSMDSEGLVYCWSLEHATAVYSITGLDPVPPGFSRMHKYFASWSPSGIRVFVSRTGEQTGLLKTKQGIKLPTRGVAFHPSGSRLAAFYLGGARNNSRGQTNRHEPAISIWDLNDGRELVSSNSHNYRSHAIQDENSNTFYQELSWLENDLMMLNFSKVLDPPRGRVIWDYQRSRNRAVGFGADNRLWYLNSDREKPTLSSLQVPNEAANQVLAQESDSNVSAVLREGSKMPIYFSFPKAEDSKHPFTAAVTDLLTQRLQSVGIETSVESSQARPFLEVVPSGKYQLILSGKACGFVVDRKGHVLCSSQSITGAAHVTVRVADGRTLEAEVIDTFSDFALLKVEADGLEPIPLSTAAPGIGSETHWIGWSGDAAKAAARSCAISGIEQVDKRSIIQTDIGSENGWTGCPLVNDRGEVVGLNILHSGTRQSQTYGFASPITAARPLLSKHRIAVRNRDTATPATKDQFQSIVQIGLEVGSSRRLKALPDDDTPALIFQVAQLTSADVLTHLSPDGQAISFQRLILQASLALVDRGGVLWQEDTVNVTFGGTDRTSRQAPQEAYKRQWHALLRWIELVEIPSFLVRSEAGPITLPGQSPYPVPTF